MNSRFKGLGFGKRKSTASIQSQHSQAPTNHSATPPPGQIPQYQLPPQGPTPPPGAAASTTSLPMNHPGQANRPPSYSSANYPPGAAPQGGPPPGAPLGRTSPFPHQGPARTPPSQMVGGPPPINTGAPVGYPPNMNPMGQGPPPMGGPPPPGFGGQAGYPPGAPPPPGGPIAQQFQRANPAAEVEGASKSKAQLIVGIDFVRTLLLPFSEVDWTRTKTRG
jgi:hypothetical protein